MKQFEDKEKFKVEKAYSEAWNSKADPSVQSTHSEIDDKSQKDISNVNLKEMRVLLNVLNEVSS